MKVIVRIFVLSSVLILIGCSSRAHLNKRETLPQATDATQSKGVQYEIVEHTLKNGLKVLILEKPAMPVVSVQVWYKVGSVNETDGFKGMAHLFEHMMFRGSKNFGPEEHARLVKEAGGRSNAYTADEFTVYWEKLPADKLNLALTLEADRMASLTLNQDILNTERQVVMEEYRMRIDNDPVGSMIKQGRQLLFPGHPYEFGPIGKMEHIAGFTVADCQNFFDTFYAPNNAVLIIAGDVQAQRVIDTVESQFGSIKSGPPQTPPEMALDMGRVAAKNQAQTKLPVPVTVLAFHTTGARHADSMALKLIFNSLAEGRSSRLWKVLVKEKKLAEHFVGGQIQGRENGFIFLAGVHLPYLSGKVEANILRQLDQIKTEGLKSSEFIKARNQLYSQMVFERYLSNELATEIGYSEVARDDYRLFYKMDEEIKSVTQADIIRVANKYFNKDNMKIVYFKPKEGIFFAGFIGFIKSIFN